MSSLAVEKPLTAESRTTSSLAITAILAVMLAACALAEVPFILRLL